MDLTLRLVKNYRRIFKRSTEARCAVPEGEDRKRGRPDLPCREFLTPPRHAVVKTKPSTESFQRELRFSASFAFATRSAGYVGQCNRHRGASISRE